jgi:uncharacterized protein (DUF736 family)
MTFDNMNSGALFRNKDKVEGDNKPNYKGTINMDGKDMDVAGWMNTSKGGVAYMSLKLSEKREQQSNNQHQNQDGMGGNSSVSDLEDTPF